MALYRTKNNTPGCGKALGITEGKDNSWVKASGANALSAISQDLPPVPEGTSITMDDISIPSPWAKFVSFEAVLFGGEAEYGQLYKQALADWRGLLTLIAVHDVIGIDIRLGTFIDINSPKHPSEGRLFKNLKLLRPANYIFEDISCWDRLTPINICEQLQEFTIGMLSNSTLVCPPYSYPASAQTLLATKPFFANGRFVDPIPFINSSADIKYAMYTWLTQLSSYLRCKIASNSTLGSVIKLVDEFAAAIGNPQTDNAGINVTFPAFAMSNIHDLISSIKLDLVVSNDPSPLQLKSSGSKKLILVGNEIMGVSSTSSTAQSIKIIEAKTLSQIGGFKSKDSYYAGAAVPDDTVIYIADDLLLDKLTLIDCTGSITNETADTGIYNMLGKDIIWPVNPDLFEYLSANEIRAQISIERTAASEYSVKLRLKLIAGECEIIKKYGQDDINIISETNIPYLSIWPYAGVYRDGAEENLWKKYYVYSAYYDNEYCPFRVGAKTNINAVSYKMNYVSDGYITRSMYIYENIPTHIMLYDKVNPEKYIGSVLLASPQKCNIQGHTKWEIGFDFGTTSTTAFCKSNQASASFIQLGTEYITVKNNSTNTFEKSIEAQADEGLFVALNPATFENDSQRNFVPDMYLKRNAYPSMYEQHSSELDPAAPEAFVKGHALFDYSGKESGSLTKIYTDLKWSSDPNVRAAARNYIYQILSQVVYAAAIKNVGEITWKFSYPTALSRSLLEGYKRMTSNIVSMLEQDSGIKCIIEPNRTFYTESIAAAEYFGTQSGAGLFICIDIGGGSTDISVWKKGINTENLLQTSINLASRAIFHPSIVNLIANDKEIGNYVVQLNSAIAKEVQNSGGEITDSIRMGIEGILFEYENRVQEIVNSFESGHKKRFQKCISIGFVGLLYYAAGAVAYVKDKITDENSLTICLGGNGSKLYNWFPDFYKSELVKCLREYVNELIGRDMLIEIDFDSVNLKTEAAKGILNIDGTENDYSKNTVAIMGEKAVVKYKNGETVEINDNDNIYDNEALKHYYEVKGAASELNNPEDIAEVKIDKELNSLHTFLELCNKIHTVYEDTEMLVKYSDDDWTKIYDSIKVNQAREIREGIMSPAFALGVKAILARENKA